MHWTRGWIALPLLLSCALSAGAEVVEVDLTIREETVAIAGLTAPGMTIDGGIPGPTLTFREGDTARIRVHNEMDVGTSIHWHGLLVPNLMDGVPYVTQPQIEPGTTFVYEFPIRQAGTYWYHSHTRLQEQRGMYGTIVILPADGAPEPAADRDVTVLFSDWTTEDPEKVLATLKSGDHWYATAKGSAQSILGAARVGMIGDWFSRELQRMPPMDIADVAYDRFLANGEPETTIAAGAGETVRVRIVDGSASTFFHLGWAAGPMTVVAADGQDVVPVQLDRVLIGVAETYDVLVEVPGPGLWELRATSHDGSSWASAWIGGGTERHPAPDVPWPNLYPSMGDLSWDRVLSWTPAGAMGMSDEMVASGAFDQPGMHSGHDMGAMGMDAHGPGTPHDAPERSMRHQQDAPTHEAHQGRTPTEREGDHGAMPHEGHGTPADDGELDGDDVPFADDIRPYRSPPSGKRFARALRPLVPDVSSRDRLAIDGVDPARPMPPYPFLEAREPTGFDDDRPVREIRLTLDGDMDRYVWFMNETALSASDAIRIRSGELVRFIMINRTMMHHPMHLHGHFFRVVNEHGDRSPLKHTVDVAPMATTVIEFAADEIGDWFFHCHLLYHMESGMARTVEYESWDPPPEVEEVRPRLYHDRWFAYGTADVTSAMSEGIATASDVRNILALRWEAGWGDVDATHWETDLTYDRYVNRFLQVFVGGFFEGVEDDVEETRAIAGVRYLLPLNVGSTLWIDSDGGARVGLEKHWEVTPRITVGTELQYDSHEGWEEAVDASWRFSRPLRLVVGWHSEYGVGAGLGVRF